MDLESAVAELYATAPDAFITRRAELVRAARLAGDRALATAIGKLRKPTRSAWLVNLYARSASDELAELLELGAALRVAQEQLSTADLRRLSAQRNTVVTAASRRAVALAEARGYRASESVRQEVNLTLQAALADPTVAEQMRAGTVTEAHTYGGFGPLTPSPGTATPPPAAASELPTGEPPEDELERARSRRARAERLRAEQARAEAEHRLHAAEAELERATDAAEDAVQQVTKVGEQIATLHSQLRDLEQAQSQAEQRAADARTTVVKLQDRVRAAREARDAL